MRFLLLDPSPPMETETWNLRAPRIRPSSQTLEIWRSRTLRRCCSTSQVARLYLGFHNWEIPESPIAGWFMENPMHMDGGGKHYARLDHPKSFVLLGIFSGASGMATRVICQVILNQPHDIYYPVYGNFNGTSHDDEPGNFGVWPIWGQIQHMPNFSVFFLKRREKTTHRADMPQYGDVHWNVAMPWSPGVHTK